MNATQVFCAMVATMMARTGIVFSPTDDQQAVTEAAITRMLAYGITFTPDLCRGLVMGSAGLTYDLARKAPGYQIVDQMIDMIMEDQKVFPDSGMGMTLH